MGGSSEAWLSDGVVVGDQTREYEYVQQNRRYRQVDEDPRVYSVLNDGGDFTGKGKEVSLQWATAGESRPNYMYAADTNRENGGPDGKNTIYLPLHRACLHIAITAQLWEQAATTPLRMLYRVLRHRFQVVWEQELSVSYNNRDQNGEGFYGSNIEGREMILFSGFQNIDGIERGYFHEKSVMTDSEDYVYLNFRVDHGLPEGHYLSPNPLDIPDLTATLLANLEPRVRTRPKDSVLRFRKCLTSLPNELQHYIFEYVTKTQDWPLECTRLLGNRFWKTLFNQDFPCMSWLFDLDQEMVWHTDPNFNMDWETLFRKVQQGPRLADSYKGTSNADYQSYQGILEHIPPGLEGRRRVVKLLGEMYIGDKSINWRCDHQTHETARRVGPRPYQRRDRKNGGWVTTPTKPVLVYWGRYGKELREEILQAL